MEGEKLMKDRISIHFCTSYIYLVLVRNLLNGGLMYGEFNKNFQLSLVYCVILAIAITILLEMWKMMLEVIDCHYFGYIFFLCPIVSIMLSAYLGSAYYASIILYLAVYITKDSFMMFEFNKVPKIDGKQSESEEMI